MTWEVESELRTDDQGYADNDGQILEEGPTLEDVLGYLCRCCPCFSLYSRFSVAATCRFARGGMP